MCAAARVSVALLAVTWARVAAFNLDPRIPVIKKGPKGTHFGYSVAVHQTVVQTFGARNQTTSW